MAKALPEWKDVLVPLENLPRIVELANELGYLRAYKFHAGMTVLTAPQRMRDVLGKTKSYEEHINEARVRAIATVKDELVALGVKPDTEAADVLK